jgi:hypothetical protein
MVDFNEQILAALGRLDSKIDGIREGLSEQRVGLASLEAWKASVQEEHKRLREQAEGVEKRLRTQEATSAVQKAYAAVAAVVCSAVFTGAAELLFRTWGRQ